MKKLITISALAPALALTLAATAPAAHANGFGGDMTFNANPINVLIGLLLPAVQKVREAAAR